MENSKDMKLEENLTQVFTMKLGVEYCYVDEEMIKGVYGTAGLEQPPVKKNEDIELEL